MLLLNSQGQIDVLRGFVSHLSELTLLMYRVLCFYLYFLDMQSQKQGVMFAIAAFLMWGLAPIYFKAIDHVAAMEILLHRVMWSVLFLLVILTVVKKWQAVRSALFNVKTAGWLLVSAALLGFNWGLFIWAVNNNHMLDASLGYYINPLLNVLLGVVFFAPPSYKLRVVQH